MFRFRAGLMFRFRAELAVVAAVAVLFAWPMPRAIAQAAAPNGTATGKSLAQQYCATCHVVTPTGHGGWTDAPRFDAIANRAGESADKLSTFIQKGHLNMLHDQRPKPEADAIAAYILSLRKH